MADSVRGRFGCRSLMFNSKWQASTLPPTIYQEPELTDLGRIMTLLPVDPQQARLLLFGLALKCFHPIVSLVAALSHREPCKFFNFLEGI